MRIWANGVLAASLVRVEVHCSPELEPGKSYVFLANHQSLFDIPVLLATSPGQLRMMAKRSLFRIPIFGWALKAGGFIPVDRADRSTATPGFSSAFARLRAGPRSSSSPRGPARSTDTLLPFQRGGFLLALKSGLPIVPVGIRGHPRRAAPGSWAIHPGTVAVPYGAPIDTAAYGMRRKRELISRGAAPHRRARRAAGRGGGGGRPDRWYALVWKGMDAMTTDFESTVWDALKGVKFPGMSRDIVSFGFVHQVQAMRRLGGGGPPDGHPQPGGGREGPRRGGADAPRPPRGGGGAGQHERGQAAGPRGGGAEGDRPGRQPDPRGRATWWRWPAARAGVGKSTVAANLAVALAQLGHRVGLLDADIYGPSVPTMFGITEKPRVIGNRIFPFEKYGVNLMSLGFILETDTPVIWRGPMVMRAIEQMLGDVEWGELDYLILDLPPGTGDAQLTVTQRIPLAGAVIVTTPQDVALIDARKGLAMFRKVNVPVIGIVENMSTFVCPHCGEATDIFKQGRRQARRPSSWARPSWARSRSIPRSSSAATPACRSPSPSPRGRTATPSASVAEAVVAEVARQEEMKPKLSIVYDADPRRCPSPSSRTPT